MTSPPAPAPYDVDTAAFELAGAPSPPRAATFLASVLVIGAFTVVLAGVNSTVFELERHAVPKELVLHVTALLCLLPLLLRWERVAPGVVAALLGLFVIWSALSSVFATNRWLALNALSISFSGLVVFVAASRVARAPHARAFALVGITTAAVLAAALGAAQAYGLQLEWLAEDRAPGGTFGNRNFLAHVVVIALPLPLLALLRSERRLAAALSFVAVGVMTNLVVLTRSRAAWLAFVAVLGIVAIGALLGRRAYPTMLRKRRAGWVVLAIVTGGLLAVSLPNRLEWRSDSPYAETLGRLTDYSSGSGRGRLMQWQNSLRLVPDAPVLGVGPGNWFVHYPRVTTPGDRSFAGADAIPTNPWPSSDWITMVVERGPFGALLLLFTGLAACAIALRRVATREPALEWAETETAESTAGRSLTALAILAATVVTGLFDAVLLLGAPTLLVWASLGLLLPSTRPVLSRPPSGRWRRAAVLAVLLFAVTATLTGAGRLTSLLIARDRPTRADLALAARFDPGGHRVRLLLTRRGTCQERIPYARAARDLMPFHAAPERALRACGARE